jgi:hypothetical protein
VEWVDLVAPSAAILSLFGVVALVVVAIRQGRHIRRLEERLSRTGDAAVEAPLQRIAELQARATVSEGASPAPGREGQLRTLGIVAVLALVLATGIGGVWYLFLRDDGGGTPTAQAGGSTTAAQTAVNPPEPVDTTLVPDEVPPVDDRTLYTVAVFNASGIQGAAGEVVAPQLEREGWITGTIANAPSTRQESVVMFTGGKRRVAWNVAEELGIERTPPIDGLTAEEIGNADVVVLVGLDIANNGAAPAP